MLFPTPTEPPPPTIPPFMTLKAFGEWVKRGVRGLAPIPLWVAGEVAKVGGAPGGSGHVYLDLIEKEGASVAATLTCALWENRAKTILPTLPFKLVPGLKILIRITLDFYPPGGRLSGIIHEINPAFTVGEFALERDRHFALLKEEGVAHRNRELSLPFLPQRIGLITAERSEAWNDFTHELHRCGMGGRILFVPARMQGVGSPGSMIQALRRLSLHSPDLVVLIRGGGSRGDLHPFNDLLLGREIARCPVPVFTGIGHQGDLHLADLVACRHFKTPTAVAQGIVGIRDALALEVEGIGQRHGRFGRDRLSRRLGEIQTQGLRLRRGREILLTRSGRVEGMRARIQALAGAGACVRRGRDLFHRWERALGFGRLRLSRDQQGLNIARERVRQGGRDILGRSDRLREEWRRLARSGKSPLSTIGHQLDKGGQVLELVHPRRILNRGFMLMLQKSKIIGRTDQLDSGAEFTLVFGDGAVSVTPATMDFKPGADPLEERLHEQEE